MKPALFATSVGIILFTSAASNAGNGYFTKLGRNLGYGISDGYHAQRYCLPGGMPCSAGSPFYQPMMQQPMMQQPVMAPTPAQWAPPQFQPAGYPASSSYPVMPVYQPWYQPSVPTYGVPVTPSQARPAQSPVLHW